MGERNRELDVPELVRLRAVSHGDDGIRWLAALPSLISELEHAWSISVGAPLSRGTAAYVAEADTADGTRAVVKIAVPEGPGAGDFGMEVRTLRAGAGRGYVRLLAHDDSRRAMLLERLGARLNDLGLSINAQLRAICETLQEAWVPAGADVGLPTGADKAVWLSAFITGTWEQLSRPCSERVVQCAVSYADARGRAFDPAACVLVHGDAHAWNTLQDPSRPGRFKFVDPDGLVAERAYDLAIPMREWADELLAGDALELGRRRCAYLSELSGVEQRAIWEWGFVERVPTGLLLLKIGSTDVGRDFLAVAEQWAV